MFQRDYDNAKNDGAVIQKSCKSDHSRSLRP